MPPSLVLARYGEIGLKSRTVRNRFETILRGNIEHAFEMEGLDVVVKRIPGRFVLHTTDPEKAGKILPRVFGLTSFSIAQEHGREKADILEAAVAYARRLRAQAPAEATFAIRARRSGQHPYTSQEIARDAGAAVLKDEEASRNLSVNLKKPDFAVHIDIRDNRSFLYHEMVPGPGGLPLGTAGRMVVLLKDANSLVAAWMMMKRGATLLPIHFEGKTGSNAAAVRMHQLLRRWFVRAKLRTLDFPEAEEFPAAVACGVCIRAMVRRAAQYAKAKRARSLVTGETLGSTTAVALALTPDVGDVTVLRPLMGLLPDIIASQAKVIGLGPGERDTLQEPCPLRVIGPYDLSAIEAFEAVGRA